MANSKRFYIIINPVFNLRLRIVLFQRILYLEYYYP